MAGLLLIGAGRAAANGYKILCVRSAKATAMGEAFVAQADDASAIAFNPAGLAQLQDTAVSVQGTLCNAFTEREAPSGEKTDIQDHWQLVPAFFLASDMGFENLGFGFGVSYPNGLSSEWGNQSFARYVATYSDLNVADVSPGIGWRIGHSLLLGVAADFYYSEATLKKMVDVGAVAGAPGQMDVQSKLEGDGSAWGFNVGGIYTVNERHSLALTYRHPFSIDYDGNVKLGELSRDASTTVEFPGSVVIGYAYRPTSRLKIEFDLDWTDWSQVGDIRVKVDDPSIPDSVMQEDLEDTLAWKIGLEYAATDCLDLRCGYIYNENATPDRTWRPSLPDTDMHFFTAGFGYRLRDLTVDGAVQVVYYEKRTIGNNVDDNETLSSSGVDGTYRTWAPCFSLAATYHF